MKYAIKKTAAAASRAALLADLQGLSLTVEGQTFRLRNLLGAMANFGCSIENDYQPVIYIETNFKVQAVSAGFTLETITDKGQIVLSNFTHTSIAKFTKGVFYLIQTNDYIAMQMVAPQIQLYVPTLVAGSDAIVIQPEFIPYFAYDETTPQGLTSVNVIAIDYNTTLSVVQANEKAQSNAQRVQAATNLFSK